VLLTAARRLAEFVGGRVAALVPGSDVPSSLALAHTLVAEGLHDRASSRAAGVGSTLRALSARRDGRLRQDARVGRALSEILQATIRGWPGAWRRGAR